MILLDVLNDVGTALQLELTDFALIVFVVVDQSFGVFFSHGSRFDVVISSLDCS